MGSIRVYIPPNPDDEKILVEIGSFTGVPDSDRYLKGRVEFYQSILGYRYKVYARDVNAELRGLMRYKIDDLKGGGDEIAVDKAEMIPERVVLIIAGRRKGWGAVGFNFYNSKIG